MTATEHRAAAERLLEVVADGALDPESAPAVLTAALVHAVLALTAA